MSQPENISRRAFMTLAPERPRDALTHIASLLVQAMPETLDAVRTLIRSWPDSEVHDTPDPRKVAVVLEAANDRAIGDAVTAIQALAGVLSVSIVAHLAESEAALREEHRHG
jgi:nitrate reductase NapAB chaperone NapD